MKPGIQDFSVVADTKVSCIFAAARGKLLGTSVASFALVSPDKSSRIYCASINGKLYFGKNEESGGVVTPEVFVEELRSFFEGVSKLKETSHKSSWPDGL